MQIRAKVEVLSGSLEGLIQITNGASVAFRNLAYLLYYSGSKFSEVTGLVFRLDAGEDVTFTYC